MICIVLILSSFIMISTQIWHQCQTIRCFSRMAPRCLSFFPSQEKSDQAALTNNRFWMRTFDFNLSSPITSLSRERAIDEICRAVKTSDSQIPISLCEFGLLISPRLQLLLPIHEGVPQPQHSIHLSEVFSVSNDNCHDRSMLQLSFCGFSTRAQHRVLSTNNDLTDANINEVATPDSRVVDSERFAALTVALPTSCSDITLQTLLGSDEFQGTPPVRIARSFICPRKNRTYLAEPTERAAKRCADQISLAVRRLRADRHALLRNTDRPSSNFLEKGPSVALEEGAGKRHPVVLVLDNLRSAFNVGSLFRTAETAGLTGVVTAGITPHPPHCDQLRKTGFQAIDNVPTRHFDDVLTAVEELQRNGYTVVALETTADAVNYTQLPYNSPSTLPLAVVVGNEVTGVDTRVLGKVYKVLKIPTYGQKNSLNVAAAAPIMLFEVLRQLNSSN